MQVLFQTDQFGRLTCDISDAGSDAVVTASNVPEARNGLLTAVDSAVQHGLGECFWTEACGEYRWVFRRERDVIRVAIMWSNGTLTGWEHVFWSECDVATFSRAVQAGLSQLA